MSRTPLRHSWRVLELQKMLLLLRAQARALTHPSLALQVSQCWLAAAVVLLRGQHQVLILRPGPALGQLERSGGRLG